MKTICGVILAAAMAVSNVGLANAKPMAELDAKGVVVNGEATCEIERRTFPDGEAVRYRLPDGVATVSCERTEWRLPADAHIWYQPQSSCYEAPFKSCPVGEVSAGEKINLPITARLADGTYRLLTEANVVDYTDSCVEYCGDGRFAIRYCADEKGFARSGVPYTPWRVTLVAKDLQTLATSDIVRRLCPAPSAEVAAKAAKFVRPGRAVWQWLPAGDPKYGEQKEWYDRTGALGFEYYLIDDGWKVWRDGDMDQWACLKKWIDYGKSIGVASFVWVDSKEMRTPEARRAYLGKVRDCGAVGIKIDFVPEPSCSQMKWYEETLADTLEFSLMTDFHGCVKPSGRERRWPHEVAREAIRGHEWHITRYNRVLPPEHDCILPFNRLVQGHADYTPMVFEKKELQGFTWARELAQGVIFSAPFLCFGDYPKNYLENSAVELIKAMPSTYDEVRVLPGSEIGECAAFAKRKGKDWFIAIENGAQARRMAVALDFLGEGKYELLGFADADDRPDGYRIDRRAVGRDGKIDLALRPCGGYCARIVPDGESSSANDGGGSGEFVAAARRAYAGDPMCRTTIVTNFAVRGKPDDKTPGLVRWYDVEGARNVRDIGGWTGLRAGRVFRGTELNSKPNHKQYELTERGRAVMRGEMGIVSDLDLRGEIAEYGEDAKTKSPIGEGSQLLSCPVSSYVETCTSPRSAKAFANALRVFADEKNYPVYVHCAGGADRTGTVCFLLEALCGVSLEDAEIEYELTSFSPVGMRRRNSETGLPFALMVRLISTFPGEAFADKVAYWAENVAGLTKDEIARIRANLVNAPGAAAVALAAGAKTVDFPIPDAVRSWDIPERATNGVKAVWIENVPWHGKPTRFFAYYSLPEGATAEKKVPGIVLVHGGYGTAFHTWVRLWNDRGYAAIAMDNCGGIPGEKNHTAEHPRHEWSGPNGWGRYEEEALPPEEQWVYHAIECVIRSHTFLRNLPEVDASKIGVTGISWGGFLTSIACGADQRFAFAAPVYGCGNLRRHSVFAPEIGELWESLWNPVEYAKNCRIPTLWCTGTNDYFFPLDSFKETAFAAGNPLFSIKLRMKHGHPPDGDPPEIAAFADSVVKGGRKLADRKIARREWLYTESANPVWKDRPFEVSAEAPQNWTIRFENAITEDGLILSSPPEFQTATLDAKGVVVNGATIRETEPGLSSAWLYPQMDMELFRVHQMRDDVRRAGLYACHPGVLPPLRDKAEFRHLCAEDDPLPEAFRRISETHYDSAEGRRYVTVDGGLMGGGAIRSAETNWEARVFDGSWRPVAAYPDAPVPPHRERLPVDRSFSGLVATNGWYDALAEQFAYVECRANAEPRLFVGESILEMLAEKPEDFEYDATMDEVSDGCWRTRHALAFRYLRFGSEVTNVKVVPVGRRRPVKGRIVTDNARWRKMVEVGERTLALCSNDFLVDGIKRDRLPWGGDLTVSLMADAYVYGDAEIARRTLSVMDAYEGDVNGIVTYSMWTVVSHDLYQLYFGDAQFLRDRWWRIKARIGDLMSRTDETGFVVRGLDWVFIDWAKPKSNTALQAIWYGSLQAAARLADRVGDPQADDYRALAAKVRESLNNLAWDEPRGLYRADPTDAAVFGRQANIFAVVFGVADDRQSALIGDELAHDRLPPVGTPYIFGWELVVLARTGHADAFFLGLERIFGGMIDNGATTYWESYDPNETGDGRYAFYGRPWAKSLCHVWSAWPAFIFVSEGLGIRPTADGWRTWSHRPLPGCGNLKAEIPTPNGIVRLGGASN